MATTDNVLRGSVAGFIATLPMTAVMQALYQQLPTSERYPLPPEEIEIKMIEQGLLKRHLDNPTHQTVATAAHFSYGSATGALYGLIEDRLPFAPIVKGCLFGIGLWASSYLGWLPAMRVITPATEHPARRNALMIAAHIVWGMATAMLAEQWQPEQ
jgi:uncharacterized membrane protein YagU involved in acid resistance